MLYLLFLLGSIVIVTGEVIFILFWVFIRRRYSQEKTSPFTPNTCIIMPCKGADEHFSNNIEAFCRQNYAGYHLVCVVDSIQDPAYPVLQNLATKKNNIRIIVTDIIEGCSGKISALMTGVQNTQDAEVYVFADSDIKPHENWLCSLVMPLQDETVGTATSYRWYFPSNLKSYVISAWNASSTILLFSRFNCTWGGSTAIRKKLFDALDIMSRWRTGFSDDLIMTKVVKNAGYKIIMVPQSIAESHTGDNIRAFIGWGTRQFTWIQWYHPFFRIFSLISLLGLTLFIGLGVFLILFGFFVPALILVLCMFLLIIYGWQTFTTMRTLMRYPREKFGSSFVFSLTMPVSLRFVYYNVLVSCFRHSLQWQGRWYKLSDLNIDSEMD